MQSLCVVERFFAEALHDTSGPLDWELQFYLISSTNGMLVYWLGVVLHRQCWQWGLLCVGVVVVRLPRVSCLPESERSIGWLSLALGAATYCGFITFFFFFLTQHTAFCAFSSPC